MRLEQIRPLYCRTCGQCDGDCRQGLPVADMLRILTYADGYGQFALGRERFLELAPEHTSVKCADCPGCTVQCPHGVKVAERLTQGAGTIRMLKLACGVAFLACALTAQAQAPAPTCNLVPGWSQDGPARSYVSDNLFEYMDGNAEGYLIYGFQKMQGVSCKKGGVSFVIDVSDMGDADSAYGIFTANVDPRQPSNPVGMGGQIQPRRAVFVRAKYYLEIGANPEGDHTAALTEWITALDKTVTGSTTVPPAMSWFPAEKRTGLRLVPESVLGIRLLKRGYVAQYDYGKAFVVLEASPESAAAVIQKLKTRFGENTPATIADEAFQANDKYLGKLCFFRKGRYIGGYTITQDGYDGVALSKALADKIQ